jgi:hypothetical protein
MCVRVFFFGPLWPIMLILNDQGPNPSPNTLQAPAISSLMYDAQTCFCLNVNKFCIKSGPVRAASRPGPTEPTEFDMNPQTAKPGNSKKESSGVRNLGIEMAATQSGKLMYKIYRALSYGVSPALNLHLRYRRFRGREHPHRWTERLGRASLPRPPGPLLWFHAVSLGSNFVYLFNLITYFLFGFVFNF